MRKLIMWNLVTLDGYFEGEQKWDLSFHSTAWCDELAQFISEQLKTVDTLIFGKTTYEGMAAYWQAEKDETAVSMNSLPKIVCSHSLEQADWNNTTIVRDAVSEISALKKQGTGNMFVFGSSNLSANLMKADLFDEYRLLVAPVFLGKGNLLFPTGIPYRKLALQEAHPLKSGGVILRYIPSADTIS